MGKIKIFLGDLVHTWGKISVWTHPLNIGFVASYCNKQHDNAFDVRLFKRPELMLDAIKRDKPDVVALSYYVWSINLNNLLMKVAKATNPNVLAVGGGPIFTSLNANEESARKFFGKAECVDAFVINQGERPFAELMGCYLKVQGDVEKLRHEIVPGCLLNDLAGGDRVIVGPEMEALNDLDEIPSPYLNGMLDDFFEDAVSPIVETNRSCPYRCTFCAWGIGTSKLARFSLDRVLAEIEYISQRSKNSTDFFVADANFAILERDVEIARKFRECSEKYGRPLSVMVQWNKSRPDRVSQVAREMHKITMVGASMQSLNEATLNAVKRKNLSLEQVITVLDYLRENGANMMLFSELILGLPEETFESHSDAIRRLIDLGAQVVNYNLHLLPGTEMDTEESRRKYFKRIGWRLHDSAFGVYDGVKVFEGQEVVQETSTMTPEEFARFRYIHFLLQFMWQHRWYYNFLMLFKQNGIHPVDFIIEVEKASMTSEGEIGKIYKQFYDDYELERFKSFEELCDYWSQEANLQRLKEGNYGKLNFVYMYKIIDHAQAFSDFLLELSARLVERMSLKNPAAFLKQAQETLRFDRESRVSMSDGGICEIKKSSYPFDILGWRENRYSQDLSALESSEEYRYVFFLPPEKKLLLEERFKRYKSSNLNLTLRKMSEYAQFDMFQYDVKRLVDGGN